MKVQFRRTETRTVEILPEGKHIVYMNDPGAIRVAELTTQMQIEFSEWESIPEETAVIIPSDVTLGYALDLEHVQDSPFVKRKKIKPGDPGWKKKISKAMKKYHVERRGK